MLSAPGLSLIAATTLLVRKSKLFDATQQPPKVPADSKRLEQAEMRYAPVPKCNLIFLPACAAKASGRFLFVCFDCPALLFQRRVSV
jgi:hypothetical protein